MAETPYKMSQRLREELERIAGMCNNGESHTAGDRIERLLRRRNRRLARGRGDHSAAG